jgi:CBS domain-containing protein
MLVRDIMSKDIAAVDVNSSILDAAVKMKLYRIGILIVSEAGRMAGVVTDRDLVIRGLAEGADPTLHTLNRLMTTNVVTCREDEPLHEAADRMKSQQVRRLVAVDARGEPVGIISLADIASRGGDFDLAGRVVEGHARQVETETIRTHPEE